MCELILGLKKMKNYNNKYFGEAPNPPCYFDVYSVYYEFEAKSWKVAIANSPLFVQTLYFGYAGVNQRMLRTLLEPANVKKQVLPHSRFTA